MFAPSIVYSPGDPYLNLLARMSWLPVMPIPGAGHAAFQPIWAEDVAGCVMAALPGGSSAAEAVGRRYELAGPDTLTHREIVELALRSFRRQRRVVGVPIAIVRRLLGLVELFGGPTAFATWDEAELLEVPLIAAGGPRTPRHWGCPRGSMRAVLGVA